MFYSRTCLLLGILLTCAAFAFGGGVRPHPYEDHNPEYEEDPVNEDYQPSTCTGCITQADLTAALVPYLKTGDLVNTFAAHITEILGNSAVAYALKKFVQANAPACTNCPVGTNPPAVGLLLCQYQSKIGSSLTSYSTIKYWDKVYCNDYFKSINANGEFVNTGTVTREVAFDFAVRCDCKYSVATPRQYTIRRKRETMSPYDQSASAAVESTVYDPVDYFRRKRTLLNYSTSSCGNDNCVGRTATVEIYKDSYELKEVQVSNLCYVVQSFRIITKVEPGKKVFLKLKNANLLPTDKCQWTLTAAYVG